MRKKEKWVVVAKGADFKEIGRTYGVDPVIARIVRNREVVGREALDAYFYPSIRQLHDPSLLADGQLAAELLLARIREKKKIRIIGDYDIDGIFSTFILYDGLKACGARVDYTLPHRIKDGYGLNEKLIREAYDQDCDTILTCDNGIAAAAEIALAKELGMTVIVTDHHEIPLVWENEKSRAVLPGADAIVDPKRSDCAYPCKGICGAVVAWKVLQLVQRGCGQPDAWKKYMQYAAFATIGDVMELQGENRTITSLGLEQLRGTDNIGLQALMQCAGLEPEGLSAYQIGFVLGPCINATGRLDTAKRALELLIETDREQAARIAGELVALNEERKQLTTQGVEEAVRLVEEEHLLEQPVLIVYLPGTHESLAGIIAGRLRERYYRPTYVLTDGEECIKGSGRSIPAYHMYEHLSRVGHLLLKFGGHAMAAGLSLAPEHLEEFRRLLNEQADLSPEELTETLKIDVPMPLSYITQQLIGQLSLLEPFGNGNEKPVFADRGLHASRAQLIGKNKNMLKLRLNLAHGYMDALMFGDAGEFLDYYREKYGTTQVDALLNGRPQEISFSLIYYPQLNTYQGFTSIQIVITHYC